MKKDAANTVILDKLQSKTCQCTGPHRVSSSYTTDRAASIPSSSSTLEDHSEINSFNARLPVCTFDILTPDNLGRPLAGSTPSNQRTHYDSQPAAPSNNRNSNEFVSPTPFKPYNLPRYVKGGNVHTFLQLFDSSMEGATKRQKATTVINCLDSSLVELVMPHFGNNCWTYLDAREAIIAKFGSEAYIASKKDAFMRIKFKDNETIEEFAD